MRLSPFRIPWYTIRGGYVDHTDEVPIEIAAPIPIGIYRTVQPTSDRRWFPPAPEILRICAWHDERTFPGKRVSHIMCQMCYDRVEAEMFGGESR